MAAGTTGGRRRRVCIGIFGCLLATLLLIAPAPAAPGKGKPKRSKSPFVYLFVLDGLDRDAVTAESKAPFLSGLIAGAGDAHGVFFPRSRSVMVAETNPNHASMITGAYPESHGIPGNAFATPGAGENDDSCPSSPGGPPTVTSGESPTCLEAETAFTALERQAPDKRYTTALISGKPKLARLFATKAVTPDSYDADHIFAPCDDDEPYCRDVPTDPIAGSASDEIVMDEVIRTTREGVTDSGSKRRPDFTFANFPSVDLAGHTYGRTSSNYTTAVGGASAQIGRFVANQKELGIWRRTVMVIVSDHGMDDTPQAQKISLQALLLANGISSSDYTVVGNGSAAHIYLTDRESAAAPELLKRMRTALAASPSINEARYLKPNPVDGGSAHTIAATNPPWFLGGPNTGDIVVSTVPGVGILEASEVAALPFNPLQGNHGSTATRDNFWLIAGGGRLIKDEESARKVNNANAAPTALRLLGARPPGDAQEKAVKQAFRAKYLKRRSGR